MPPRTRGGDISSAPRRRPTGLERRRRVQLREVESVVDRDPVEHPQHDRDETEEVFESVPGGPIDRSILRSFSQPCCNEDMVGRGKESLSKVVYIYIYIYYVNFSYAT